MEKAGFTEIAGIESGSLDGLAQWPATQNPDFVLRDSSETSYGTMAVEHTDLKFYQNTLAKQIVFDGKIATGVKVESSGATYTLTARKEVILAAGAVSWLLASKNECSHGILCSSCQVSCIDHGFSSAHVNCSWFQALAPPASFKA